MKHFFAFIVSLLFLIWLFGLSVLGSEALSYYTDDMTRLDNSAGKQYYNLKTGSGKYEGVSDNSFFIPSNSHAGTGGVIYRVSGATGVSVSILSNTGTTVVKSAGGRYALGVPGTANGKVTSIKAMFSPSDQMAYINDGGKIYSLVYEPLEGYVFCETEKSPKDLVTYGINISASKDGKAYISLNQVRTAQKHYQGSGRVQEQWEANISSNMKYIKVEINDTPYIYSSDSSMGYQKSDSVLNALAEVTIAGENLIIGENEAQQKEEVITSSPSSTEDISSQKSENSKSSAKKSSKPSAKGEAGEKSSAKKSSLPEGSKSTKKFEGAIIDEPKEKKSSTSSKKSEKVSEKEKSESESSITEATELHENQRYIISGNSTERDNFTGIVIVYIVIVCIVILFLLLRPKE